MKSKCQERLENPTNFASVSKDPTSNEKKGTKNITPPLNNAKTALNGKGNWVVSELL